MDNLAGKGNFERVARGLDVLTFVYACRHANKACVMLCLPHPKLSRRCISASGRAGCEGGTGGGGGRERKRLVRLIQLMKDLCRQSSCLPLSACRFQLASFCHSVRD